MGKLLSITGIDGSGKTTQVQLLKEYLSKKKQTYLLKFPNKESEMGRLIYKQLEDPNHDPYFMQGAQTLCRLENQTKIIFLLNSGYDIICDRYIVDSVVYGSCAGVNADWIVDINSHLVQPDIDIYIDIPVEESFKRREVRRDSYESNFEFLQKVRDLYRYEFSKQGNRYIIDGIQSVEDIQKQIRYLIEN